MIKAIVTDVNGVLRPFDADGFSDNIITALRDVHAAGVAVMLCTSNPYWFIDELVTKAALTSPQIVNAGRTVIFPGTEHVEEMSLGSKKAEAVSWVLDSLKIYPQDVLAVGDMPIDLAFMKLCGSVATLADAHGDVREYVAEQLGFIAPPAREDGFVQIIKKFV